jgi:DNA-binding CsgD family transcriptional regulator
MAIALTPTQHEYARLYAAGVPRQEIARRMGVCLHTADGMLWRIRTRLGVKDRREMSAALLDVVVRERHGGQMSALGLLPGDPIVLTGGRFAGRSGEYVGASNSRQTRVRVGGGVFSVRRWFVATPQQQEAA